MANPDPITRLNEALEGRYRIERELGAGGMATVYLAEDVRHRRNVALKVLKPELAAVVGSERFLAEIETTANLQHPHILPLFDSGEADGFLFYVMPYVAGESLRDRLDREHQLPVDEAVRIASNVAEALDYAHRQGVIHRDIKPANVLLQDGKPVISDFGIALAIDAAGGGRLTETGLSLGTPHYMSPEQATGDLNVGPATDIYALGCVLYEMLVGEPPHTGATPQAVLGKIITGETPSAIKQRPSVPRNVDAAIGKALEKIPADRFTDAMGFRQGLADSGFRQPEGETGSTTLRRRTVVIALTLMVLTIGWVLSKVGSELTGPVVRVESPFREGQEPIGPVTFLRDGRAVVYVGPGDEGVGSQLWLREWNDLESYPIEGTDGASGSTMLNRLSMSPSWEEVAFVTGAPGPLRVAPVDGGAARTLVNEAYNATWSEDGWVFFSTTQGIRRVGENGGESEVVTELTGDERLHGSVVLVPGGKHVLFDVFFDDPGIQEIRVLDLETGRQAPVTSGSNPLLAPSGHLLFKEQGTGRLMAAEFNARRGTLSGEPFGVIQDLHTEPYLGGVTYTVSDEGMLLYLADGGRDQFQFVWVDRTGEVTPVVPGHTFDPGFNPGWRLSPDGTSIAYGSRDAGNTDIRVLRLPDGPDDRLTSGLNPDTRPFWSPDGTTVYYSSGPEASDRNVWMRPENGTREPVLVLDDVRSLTQGQWSPDGRWMVFRTAATATMGLGSRGIVGVRPERDSASVILVDSPEFAEQHPSVSPDGRWLAYSTNESGRDEVVVRSFPDVESTRVAVSLQGGSAPIWSANGQELFYTNARRQLVAVEFAPATGEVIGRTVLFEIPLGYVVNTASGVIDVAPDGERFLMARPATDGQIPSASRYVLVIGFLEELRRAAMN